jgi:hypothetical protein
LNPNAQENAGQIAFKPANQKNKQNANIMFMLFQHRKFIVEAGIFWFNIAGVNHASL